MRPIKEIQEATHFKMVWKKDLVETGQLTDDDEEDSGENLEDDEDSQL